MEHIKAILSGHPETIDIVVVVMRTAMAICAAIFILSLLKYLKDYRIWHQIKAKISGDAFEYDRVRRAQMRNTLESQRKSFSKEKKKKNFWDKIYLLIAQTGILEAIPGFSEIGFIGIIGVIGLILFGVVSICRTLLVGIVITIAYFIVIWYSISLLAYNRKMKLEKQLLQFTNACASASLQYSNIIDIFGAIYDQFSSPLREGLEACYVEAKSTNNKEVALKHLKERYDSTQFSFIIDNLELCSQITGNYHATAKDVCATVSIYSESHEKKRVLVRNAKVNIIAMFVISLVILMSLSVFVGGIVNMMLHSTVGNILTIALVLVFFYGINIKAEK